MGMQRCPRYVPYSEAKGFRQGTEKEYGFGILPYSQALGCARWSISHPGICVSENCGDDCVRISLSSPLLSETYDSKRQNNSIADLTVQDIAFQIQQNHLDLVSAMVEEGKSASLACSSTAHSVRCLEDVVAKSHRVLGSFLHTIPKHC